MGSGDGVGAGGGDFGGTVVQASITTKEGHG